MPGQDLLLRSRRVVTPEGVRPACVRVREGVIHSIASPEAAPAGAAVEDVGSLVLMPGLVDSHVHINEPGRTDWEGFESATRAAAAGGITTVVDMPLNSIPPTTTLEGFRAKRAAAEGRACVDFGLWGGVVPGNAGEIPSLLREGAPGCKCFLVPSGVDEFGHVVEKDLREAMPVIAAAGGVLLVHAELPGPLDAAAGGDPRRFSTFLRSRPRESENAAVRMMVGLSGELRCRVHIVHLSSADALEPLADARRRGVPVTAETCPHYLTFAAEDVPDGRTEFKCCPPIRERENRERLWCGLRDGVLGIVVSDHSPSPPALKRLESGDFREAWGGISSLQFTLAATWTEARRRGHGLEHIADWMCRAPARLAGLGHRKGALAAGFDADLVVWDPDETSAVEPSGIHHRHTLTPYAGRRLEGRVEMTFLRGRKVYDRGAFPGAPGGRYVPASRQAALPQGG